MTRTLDRRTLITGLGLGALGVVALAAVPALSAPGESAPAASETEQGRGAEDQALVGPAGPEHLHVMSFNIRLDLSREDEAASFGLEATQPGEADHWPDRRPLVTELLRREQPTLLGVQEMKFRQLAAIEEALPGHRHVGYGRHGGSSDEHSALFYDHERLELRAWDQFWLSDTPDTIGSSTWGNEISRLVVWARLRDRTTGTELGVINTHFDHRSEPARRRSAETLVALREHPDLVGLPLVITGDFNAIAEQSETYSTLVQDGPFEDAWHSADEQLTPAWGTFPNYDEPVEGDRRIDWILTSEEVQVEQVAINTWRAADGAFPSDHTPVQVLIALP